MLLLGLLLGGCGKAEAPEPEAPVAESAPKEESQDEAPAESVPEDGGAESPAHKTCDMVPSLLLCRKSITDGDDVQNFSYIALDADSAAANKDLADHLAKERDAFYLDAGESRDVFLRRADGDFISILTMFTAEGMFDTAEDIRFLAHSYHTDDGSEIELSEVIADEDAFYDLLAKSLADQILSQRYYGSYAGMSDQEKIKGLLKDYIDHGTAAWTIDPQGITVFTNSYSEISALPLCVTVRFKQDQGGKIFKEAFAKAYSEEWITQLVPEIYMFYDENDFGQECCIRGRIMTDILEDAEEETYAISGCIIDTAFDTSKWKVQEKGCTGYYDFFLIHTNHQNYVLAAHPEGDRAYFEEFKILNDEISKIDNFRGCLERTKVPDGEAELAYYLPTDRTAIRVLCPADEVHDDPVEAWISATVGIKTSGYFDEKPYEREGAVEEAVSLGTMDEEMKYCVDHAGPAVDLTAEMQYRYNLFLSNFAEQPDFSFTDYSVDDLCHFALEWKKINAPKEVKTDGNYYMISQSEVNEVLRMTNTNIAEGDFEGEYYKEPSADGEMYKNIRFAVVTDMHECNTGANNHRYLCNFKVYSRDAELYDAEGIGKAQYSLSAAQADKDPSLHCCGEGQALLWVYGLYGPKADVALAYYEMKSNN